MGLNIKNAQALEPKHKIQLLPYNKNTLHKLFGDAGNKKNSFKVDVFQKLKFSSIPKKIYKTMQVMPVFEFFLKD